MKRLLAALGCAAMLCITLAFPADAIIFRERRVHWITTQVPTVPPRDAIVRTSAVVAAMTAQPVDTTEWIPLWEGFSYNNTVVSLADTIGNCFLNVYPCVATGNTADTISVVAQCSVDGLSPISFTNTWGPQNLETGSANSFWVRLSPGRSAVIGGGTVTELTLGSMRFVRFIVTHDMTGCFEGVYRFQSAENWTPDPPGFK